MSNLHWKNSEAEYRRRLKVYVDKTKQNEKLFELLRDVLPPAIASIGYDLKQQSQINILSIGSGEGKTDFEILKIIKCNFKSLKEIQGVVDPIKMLNRAIEPNQNAMDIYKAAVEHLQEEFNTEEVVFDLDPPRTFEDYAVEPKGDVKFDIVQFIHSLYYIDVEEALVHCYNVELREKGTMVICIAGVSDMMGMLETQEKTLGLPKYGLTNENLSSVLQKYSWKFEEHIEEHCYNISEVFDARSEEGSLFLDFFRFEINFRSSNSHEVVSKFLDKMKKYCLCKDGKYFANSVQRIVLIHKWTSLEEMSSSHEFPVMFFSEEEWARARD